MVDFRQFEDAELDFDITSVGLTIQEILGHRFVEGALQLLVRYNDGEPPSYQPINNFIDHDDDGRIITEKLLEYAIREDIELDED